MMYLGNGKATDLASDGYPIVQDLYEFPQSDEEMPVSIASNGKQVLFIGTNAALYEFDTRNATVSFYK